MHERWLAPIPGGCRVIDRLRFTPRLGLLRPLVAAGLFYLMLTIPLTHLVNFVDARLRKGRTPQDEDVLAEEMV